MAFDPDYENAAFALYRYPPSLAAAVIFILLFLFLTLYHAYILFRTRSWFMIAFFIGGVFEFIGFCSRAKSAKQEPGYWTLMPYIVQNLFLLLAPALFAASIYMILGRIVRVTDGARCSLIKPRWMTRVFVAGDVFSFLMQSAGRC